MKRTSLPVAMALVAALSFAGVAAADDVPGRANIEDPAGDANGFNDQGFAFATGFQGDEAGAYSHEPGDILKVWFSNTPGSVSVHILTTAPPTESNLATLLSVSANAGCLVFEGIIPGSNYEGESQANVYTVESDDCGGTPPIPGALRVTETSSGQGITTLTFGMYSHPGLMPGAWFFSPTASSSVITGSQEDGALAAPQIDNTKEGLSYRIQFPTPPASTAGSPPVHANNDKETPVKNGCKKNPDKGKKKGCNKGKGHN